jgi:hypothetical protein
MPRIIGENVKNQLTIHDPISNSNLVIFYRMPTSEEIIAYESSKYKREADRVEVSLSRACQNSGEKIIEGFTEGAFVQKIGDELKPFSSDPVSPNYDPDWKPLIKKYAPDVLEVLGFHVFEGTRVISTQGEVSKNS